MSRKNLEAEIGISDFLTISLIKGCGIGYCREKVKVQGNIAISFGFYSCLVLDMIDEIIEIDETIILLETDKNKRTAGQEQKRSQLIQLFYIIFNYIEKIQNEK